MRHTVHELLERLLNAGRLAPGAEPGWQSERQDPLPEVTGDPLAGAVGTLRIAVNHVRHDLRGN